MSRYDGLIIPRSYSEYINKTDAATLSQALQLGGVLAQSVSAGNNAAVTSNAVNGALADQITYKTLPNDDFNSAIPTTLQTFEYFRGSWQNANVPTPSQVTWIIQSHKSLSAGYYRIVQIAYGADNPVAIYTRRAYSSNETEWIWNNWEKVATSSDLYANIVESSKDIGKFYNYRITRAIYTYDSFTAGTKYLSSSINITNHRIINVWGYCTDNRGVQKTIGTDNACVVFLNPTLRAYCSSDLTDVKIFVEYITL